MSDDLMPFKRNVDGVDYAGADQFSTSGTEGSGDVHRVHEDAYTVDYSDGNL